MRYNSERRCHRREIFFEISSKNFQIMRPQEPYPFRANKHVSNKRAINLKGACIIINF